MNINEYFFLSFFFDYRKKYGRKLVGLRDDAETDSYSDTDFDGPEDGEGLIEGMNEKDKIKNKQINMELLEKRYRNI
jgi:hypothetical protein